ncbi:MAG: hypothetical protein JWQ48_1453 [Conexibacter sp.]|nr:hypothetical protein [Conexibacter sp.]
MSPLLAAIHIDVNGVDVLSSSSAEPGRPAAFLMLLAFLVTWLFIRTSARLIRMQVKWWPGNVETSSGLHIHHLVWGIVLMMIAGFMAFATNLGSPWWELTAIAFGIGVGLTLDEYALWLHLEDVYWSEEGRSSIDAVVIAFLFAGLVVVGARPLDLDNSGDVWLTLLYAALALGFALITLAKGRLFLGVVAFFIPLVGIYCACRLGKPRSIWARKRYRDATARGRRQLERAVRRWPPDRRSRRIGRRLQDLIGGTPSPELEATPAAGEGPPPAGPAA